MRVDPDAWTRELEAHDQLFAKLGAKRPAILATERARLGERLGA
jgi:GTP-dependent phosphoenolpyruvate carboxykinase